MADPVQEITGGLAANEPLDTAGLRELLRFAELGRLSASLLHEISNPLTATILHLDQYSSHQDDSVRQARRSIKLLQRYVEAARQQLRLESQPRLFRLQTELEQVKRIVLPLAKRQGIQLQFEHAANLRYYGDPVKFQQIITNLTLNAVDAYISELPVADEGVVRLSITNTPRMIVIDIVDRGCGITAEQLPHLFEPFYTTKNSAGLGLGIGLSTVKRYVESDFGGRIIVSSSPRRGTCFRVSLPIKQQK